MILKNELLTYRSKQEVVRLANRIGGSQDQFDALISVMLSEDYRLAQRAAWVVSHCAQKSPNLLQKHLKSMIDNLKNDIPGAVERNTLRVLQFAELPEELLGITAEVCFNYLLSGSSAVAVKVYAMTILGNISKKYPELSGELKTILEEQLPFGSAGFRSRAKRILRNIDKLS